MQRQGRRNLPFYRISAVHQKSRRDGRVIEALGWFDPLASDPSKQIELNAERIQYWLSVGAQPSDTVRDMLGRANLLPDKLREQWEADRKAAREDVEKKKAAAAAAAEPKAEEKKAE
jgi:small subunit ribosomal protein S16